MPVYANRDELANRPASDAWVEVDDIDFFVLGGGSEERAAEFPGEYDAKDDAKNSFLAGIAHTLFERRIVPSHPKERIIVVSGTAQVVTDNGYVTLEKMQWMDVPESGLIIRNGLGAAGPGGHRGAVEVAHVMGHWKEALRISMFHFGPDRPCDYHFHDCDEYWFVFRGHMNIHLDGKDYPAGPGSILAAEMGVEHGILQLSETVEGVGFATQLEGQKRPGHLWRSDHGTPQTRDMLS